MWAILVNTLNFGFTIAVVIIANYILVIGLRDAIYFIVPGPGGRKPFNLAPGKTGAMDLAKRVAFWLAFVAVGVPYANLLVPYTIFVIAGRMLYSAGRAARIRPATMAVGVALLLAGITFMYIRSQPVIMKFGEQYSADMWIYNSGNTLLELMMKTAMRFGIPTGGIMDLAGIIPSVQKNMFGFIALGIYVSSCVLLGKLGEIFLKGQARDLPPYYMVPPARIFPLAPLALFLLKGRMDIGPAVFVVAGVYYAWGINLLVYAMRGGHWALNVFMLVAFAMHPSTALVFVALGVIDNILDLRRLAAVLGLKPRFD